MTTTRPVTQFAPDDAGGGGDWRSALGRAGLAARGVLYVVLGILALQFAFGDVSSGQVSDRGAIAYIERQPFGTGLLWLVAIGLTALALWQLTTAVTGDPVKGSEARDRALFALKGLLYGATAVTAYAALGVTGGSGGSGGSGSSGATFLLGLPFGVVLTAAIGVGVVVYGIRTLVRHAGHTEFMQRIVTHRLDHDTVDAVRTAGRWGYGAKGTVIALIGGGFVLAALQHSPDQARGLGGSLVVLARQPYGTWLLAATAIGLALYGIFSMVEARYRVAA